MTERQLGSLYIIGERLGSGAMGTVYEGRDKDGNPFAFKILRSELAEEPELVNRFVQERSSLTTVDHPNVVRMHDLVAEQSTLGIVMDLVSGGDLRQRLREAGTLAPSEVCRLGAGVAAGLAVVHEAGLVHRDLKPENVLLDTSADPAIPRVSDFGIARIADASAATRSSMMVGTPHYMAPEVSDGAVPTPAVDIYALGVILYELLCGVTPFEGGTYIAVIKRHAELAPGRPEGIPDDLWSLILDMLSKDPTRRPSARQLVPYLNALTHELQGAPAAPRLTAPPLADSSQTQVLPAAVPAAGVTATRVPAEDGVAPKHRSKAVMGVGALLAIGALVGVAWAFGLIGSGEDAEASDSPTVTTTDNGQATPSEETTSEGPSQTPSETAGESVTEAAAMPDVVGMTLSQARSQLRGVRVNVIEEFDESARDNEVLAQSVAAAATMPAEVDLTVAKQPVTIYLDAMEALPVSRSDGFYRETAQISGTSYARSLVGGPYGRNKGNGWNLSRGFRELQGTLGRSDDSQDTTTEVQVEVFLDRRVVYSEVVAFGAPLELKVDVADALRLEIVANALDGNATDIVLGDIRLLGLPGEVPELDEQ